MIADSEARVVEVRRQAEEDGLRYTEQAHLREAEIHRLRRVMQQVNQNKLASQNAARLAEEELAGAHGLNATAMHRAMTPPQLIGGPQLQVNASPPGEVDLRRQSNPIGEGQGYDRVEEVMREELEREGCTPPTHQRHGEQGSSETSSARNSR